ncbi:MAG: hypothetical protein AUI01_03455 [Ktedonobacter sp. 13_2_20CM_2_56_8]|nr:MAG: hypothetical protein AUI01_03455 [Ktedonobacter sp. 13_2_20CM_2_56_8]
MRSQGLKKALLYYDAQTNDAQLTVSVLRTAAQFGAVVTNYTQVTGFTRANGKLNGAVVCDMLTQQEVTVSARYIINAAGVFAEHVATLTGDEPKATVEPSKGIHLVVARDRLRISDTAVVLPETEDGRILYVIPWSARAIIGTTDTGSGDLDDPQANPEDIAYLLKHVNDYLEVNLTEEDILSVYAGYRPLVKSRGSHPTKNLLLAGAIGWRDAKREIEARGRQIGLTQDIVEHLAFNFGSLTSNILDLIGEDASLRERLLPELPYVRAEVVYACRGEMAMTLEDVLARRTRIMLEDAERGAGIAPEVAALMAPELGWSSDYTQAQVEQYRALVDHQREAEGLRRVQGDSVVKH